MDWSQRMNLALDFIENNLDADISIDEVARKAYSSMYHFHRMFYAQFNTTPAEYIRRRRLTKAASEVVLGNTKIIDIAFKYGYESPNAFTCAFRNIHGVTPSAARSGQVKLKAFRRASCKFNSKGKPMLDYRIIEQPAFEVLGKSKNFEFEEFVKQGPKFWKDYVSSSEYQALYEITNGRAGLVSDAPMMSVYFPNDSGSRDLFTDVLAIEKPVEVDNKSFEVFKIPKATYAEFNCTYQTSMKTNRAIYGDWFNATGYERDGNKPDVAAYFPIPFKPMKDMGVRWWIPVKVT
ncbi:AraC family transcriptional regulator [Aliikangiella marina]|uniref:AraC family transcriptional regulator n=1 Tax=Aliikangiella marina TaxID=1712262 RepID=A0A545TEA5_9GAMM|nr:AraC family transcriptional regulator [Aliikangiella marina]TQV75553.1 AraC family transcriptional regulator [Aliikangiella marina]